MTNITLSKALANIYDATKDHQEEWRIIRRQLFKVGLLDPKHRLEELNDIYQKSEHTITSWFDENPGYASEYAEILTFLYSEGK